ncbi:hypothetical protein GCM10025864_07200 [Luteimicrobium album]|uniref:Uncharacterized protein n=1 Tax=Luteimicrobium album TaxID=1054550 RepID=A0ABQ6HWV9_9MICO|nr:DoxX family protein [Luteimicrobium album]GMA22961.1 hypothetical protein GCM10025864_07200 [Luteimicrobium album]
MTHAPDVWWPAVLLAAALLSDVLMSLRPPAFIRDCLTGVGFPRDWWWVLIVIKLGAVAGLLVGLSTPGLAVAASAGAVLYFPRRGGLARPRPVPHVGVLGQLPGDARAFGAGAGGLRGDVLTPPPAVPASAPTMRTGTISTPNRCLPACSARRTVHDRMLDSSEAAGSTPTATPHDSPRPAPEESRRRRVSANHPSQRELPADWDETRCLAAGTTTERVGAGTR